ncbi:MAG: DUF4139 domain-containing protein [Deltaproteobacteria bacterium]|nr:DUF4139 domain-containing protein [Deltaproteobacteria bacterium]MBW2537739.1 DUF4139 domain-containing protein [Deltaproteobacteria bacterium]
MLKSLTIVDRATGKALSVSMPLDPQTWANAALATLSPGQGSLALVLDSLRGAAVLLTTTHGTVGGRIAMVEQIEEVPDPTLPAASRKGAVLSSFGRDHRITLLEGDEMQVVRLSKVRGVQLQDGDLAMQFHRSLDATAGEGMFQQVEVDIRLSGDASHDLLVSYVVDAPMWKPTYRVVLPEQGKGQALMQAWAVVDNTSGEDWSEVAMQLTSGAPIAFRYDLHTPREVHRTDLTESGVVKRARVAVGETSYDADAEPELADEGGEKEERKRKGDLADASVYGGAPAQPAAPMLRGPASGKSGAKRPRTASRYAEADTVSESREQQAIDLESLRRSTLAQARARQVSGLTQFELESRVTVPDGTSTMVALINQPVAAEETFLFKPGGAGIGYEANPYRVVRFKNSTPFVLEPGPIAIYSGGSFVGEGLSEAVGAGNSATIPFAVEPSIIVSSKMDKAADRMSLTRIVHKVLEVESFRRKQTTWTAKAQTKQDGYTVLVRHPKAGYAYELMDPPPGTEELVDAYLVPLQVPAGRRSGSVTVVEQTPSRISMSIWDGRAVELLENLLSATNMTPATRRKLQPIVDLRAEIGRIDTKIQAMEDQRATLDQRASETRRNLLAITKDPAAAALRARLSKRLEQFTQDADRLGREIVELQSLRLERKISLEDMLENLEYNAPRAKKQ